MKNIDWTINDAEKKGTDNMDNKNLLKMLNQLVQLDVDALNAYDLALDAVDDDVIRTRLEVFKTHHLNHVNRLQEEITKRGGRPPKLSKDFKGFVIEGFVSIGSAAGMKGALKMLKVAEELTNKIYGDAVSGDADEDVREIFRHHFTDEKIHLDYITNNSRG